MTEVETTSVFGYKPFDHARIQVECSSDIYNIINRDMPEMKVVCDFFVGGSGRNVDMVLLGTEEFTESDLLSRPGLRCISRIGSGIDNIRLRKDKIERLVITETHWTTRAVVEYDMRWLYNWLSTQNKSIHEVNVGVIGACGHIGGSLVNELNGLACGVYGNDILLCDGAASSFIVPFNEVCFNSDILFVHIPSTTRNCGYINSKLLDMFRGSAIIAPVRDAVIDWDGIRNHKVPDLVVDCELPENLDGLEFVTTTHHSATRLPFYFNRMIRAAINNGIEKIETDRRLHAHRGSAAD